MEKKRGDFLFSCSLIRILKNNVLFCWVIDSEIVKKSVSKCTFFLFLSLKSCSGHFTLMNHDDVVIDEEVVSTSVTVTPLLPLTVEPLLPLTVLDRFIGG